MSEYSGRAAVFSEELQANGSCDLEERQRVKIECEDSASEL
jgi:cold shock CspA family protein